MQKETEQDEQLPSDPLNSFDYNINTETNLKPSELSDRGNSKIILFDINEKQSHELNLDDLLELKDMLMVERSSYVLILQGLGDAHVKLIRREFDLHPVIDYECASNNFNNKDHILDFPDYFLLTINDASLNGEVENPVSMKIIVYKTVLMIFCKDPLFCVKQVLYEEMKIQDVFIQEFQNKAQQINNFSYREVEINETYGCTTIDSILYRLLESILCRLEYLSMHIDSETKCYLEHATEIHNNDRVEYVQKLSSGEKTAQYLQDLIRPKFKIFDSLLHSTHLSNGLKCYLYSMKTRTIVLNQKNITSRATLTKAEHIFNATLEDAQNTTSLKLEKIVNYFTAMATVCLPANYIPGMMGMNVKVPWQDDDDHNCLPWLYCWAIIIGISIIVIWFFKWRKWV
ncbi:unnamed protein product [Blepharisma stoltei]|uniref:Magnesium transporter n=1 Tax=Blepharisma stoltei TaxID=1481888 RepID=A0AAU9JID3_9CILI|nr:unnamed protein product [Blepharisma stoltei]